MLKRFGIAVVGAALAFGISAVPANAQGTPYDADTNGANPGTHTAVVQHASKRLVVYTQREATHPYPWSTLGVRVVSAYAQDQQFGIQSARIVMQGQKLANAEGETHERGLLREYVSQVDDADFGLGGWETHGPVTPGNGPLAAPNPAVVVQAQWDAFDCPSVGVVFTAVSFPSTPVITCG